MKRKQLTLPKLLKKLDGVFSQYIRLRVAAPNGYVTCVTCYRSGHYKKGMHAGHFQSRRWHGTRFDERNVNVQCVICNSFHHGEGPEYFRYMQEKYGEEVIEEIRTNKVRNFTRAELEEMIEYYKELVKGLL